MINSVFKAERQVGLCLIRRGDFCRGSSTVSRWLMGTKGEHPEGCAEGSNAVHSGLWRPTHCLLGKEGRSGTRWKVNLELKLSVTQ